MIMDEVLAVITTLSAKSNEKKPPVHGVHGMETFEEEVKTIMTEVVDKIFIFEIIADLMIKGNNSA